MADVLALVATALIASGRWYDVILHVISLLQKEDAAGSRHGRRSCRTAERPGRVSTTSLSRTGSTDYDASFGPADVGV